MHDGLAGEGFGRVGREGTGRGGVGWHYLCVRGRAERAGERGLGARGGRRGARVDY